MAIKRQLPTNPLGTNRPILVAKQATYSLPKSNKKMVAPPTSRPEDQLHFIKMDLIKTLIVSLVILGIILLVVSKL